MKPFSYFANEKVTMRRTLYPACENIFATDSRLLSRSGK